MFRTEHLTRTKGGINRQQVVGSPAPSTLFDLLNGYLSNGQIWEQRPGVKAQFNLPAGTVGFTIFNGRKVVFTTDAVLADFINSTYFQTIECKVLRNPEDADDTLAKIHFCAPFLRYLYVVAEFMTGAVLHYWLRDVDFWRDDMIYKQGDLVRPLVPSGLAYRAYRLSDPKPLWQPDVAREVGDEIEPTIANGYFYVAIDTDGTNPRSGKTEPEWVASDGAIVYEDADTPTAPEPPPTGPTGGDTSTPPDDGGRYSNPAGSFPNINREP